MCSNGVQGMTIVIDDEVCKKFVTEECLVGETLSDFAKRMKKKYDYLYTTDLKIGEVKVVLNPSINKKINAFSFLSIDINK